MDYKVYEKENELFIKYIPTKKKIIKKLDKKDYSNNPFSILNQLNLKIMFSLFKKIKKIKMMKIIYL